MTETSENLLEKTSNLLDKLRPVLQRSIDTLQHEWKNPLLEHLIQRELEHLIQQEIECQKSLLEQLEGLKEQLHDHLHPPEHELLRNKDLRLKGYPSDGPLGVTMPDGEQICYNHGSTTLVEVIKRIGIEQVRMVGLMSHSIPLVTTEEFPSSRQTRLGNYYIAVNTSTSTKIEQLREIANQLDISFVVDDLTGIDDPIIPWILS